MGVVLGADLVVEGDVQTAGIGHQVVAMPTEEECPIVGDALLEVDRRNLDAVVGQTVIGEDCRLQRQ